VTSLANGKPVEFLMRWLDKESGGNPCDYTNLHEAGIGQLDPNNMISVGTSADEQHPSPPCTPGVRTISSYDALTDDQRTQQVVPWLAYVDQQITRARTNLAQYGYDWPETSTSFWSMVKMGHVAPARISVMLAQGLAANGGVPPADWDALMATGPFPSTPASWTNNAGDVGSYATGMKTFGSPPPSMWAFMLGLGGVIALVWWTKHRHKRIGHGVTGPKLDRRIAKQSLKEERTAISAYGRRLKRAKAPRLKKALRHAQREERQHAAAFARLTQ
jgi:hypothetical protein